MSERGWQRPIPGPGLERLPQEDGRPRASRGPLAPRLVIFLSGVAIGGALVLAIGLLK